jgi:hypothetical protein
MVVAIAGTFRRGQDEASCEKGCVGFGCHCVEVSDGNSARRDFSAVYCSKASEASRKEDENEKLAECRGSQVHDVRNKRLRESI